MVSKEEIIQTLKLLKEHSPKRKFSQSVDLIFNLKDLDLKKPEEQLDIWLPLPQAKGKAVRIAALVGPEMKEQAKAACDTVITHDEFKRYEGKKKEIRNLAKKHDLFIAQANIMPDVARYFGRVLGPRGKMPNPKAGCVVPPNANLKTLTDKLKKTLHVVAKTQLSAKCSIGKEDMPEEHLMDNIMTAYNAVVHALPQEINNIRAILLKYSMGPVIPVGSAAEDAVKRIKEAAERVAAAEKKEAQAPEGTSAPAEKTKKPRKAKKADAAQEGDAE
jgi:large subunit ribosomal protein L1